MGHAVDRLLAALPSPSAAAEGEDLSLQARATLAIVVQMAVESAQSDTPEAPADPWACPNCGVAVESERSPYCSAACREQSSFVRTVRRAVQGDEEFDEERLTTLGQNLWRLLGGGLPLRISIVPASTVRRVLAREEGKCQSCGGEASLVEHIGTGCNRPINLRAVCGSCSGVKPFGDPGFLAQREVQDLLRELARRIGSEQPLRLCDDPERWDWRAFVVARKVSPKPSGTPARRKPGR